MRHYRALLRRKLHFQKFEVDLGSSVRKFGIQGSPVLGNSDLNWEPISNMPASADKKGIARLQFAQNTLLYGHIETSDGPDPARGVYV